MAGIENNIVFGGGFKLEASSSRDISDMQRTSTDVSRINHTGSPEGVVAANPSSLVHDPVSGIVYIKSSGTGNTGWTIVSTALSTVTNVSGTANRITSTGGANPVIDISSSYVGQTSITTLGTIGTGVWNATTIATTVGGTGITTYTTGDIIYASATNTLSKLPIGSNGQVLTLISGIPSWQTSLGNVNGPSSSTDNALVRFDSTTGKLIQNGVTTEDDNGNISQSNSLSGSTLSNIISNTSNTASSSALKTVQVAGSSAGDAYYNANISGGQNWSWGLDNSDGDVYVLSSSASLGTNNTMRVSPTGEINYPLQPAFSASSALQSNVTGGGQVYTMQYTTEIFDQNNDFNGSTTFTAPVTGKYLFLGQIEVSGITASHTSANYQFLTSNRGYDVFVGNLAAMRQGSNVVCVCWSVFADMDAGDTATMTIRSDGGAQVISVLAGGSFFQGYLVC